MKNLMTVIKILVAVAILAGLGVLAFAWSGLYPVSVGSGHTAPVTWLLETVRERSVAVRAADLVVPNDLESPERIAAGAGHYKSMCVDCHGKPGEEPADVFDPAPPALYRHRVDPAEAFWTIKNGLKMTAMPSHLDHSDQENWDAVAFVRALPDMDVAEYEALTADASHDHGNDGDHDHGEDSDDHHEDAASEDTGHHDDSDMISKASEAMSGEGDQRHEMGGDSPESAIEGFHHALAEGRGEAALAYLHPRVTIVEGGHIQTIDEYRAGHLASDMAFLGQIEIEQLSRTVRSAGGQATVETRSRFTGTIDGQPLDLESSEFATLIETEDGWRISQIAWNNRPYGKDDGADQPEPPDHQHASGENDHDH
jgi:mono/diheme cytochrome c family protein